MLKANLITFLLLATVFVGAAFGQAGDLEQLERIKLGIESCVEAYEEATSTELPGDVDQVNVHIYSTYLGFSFSHGEVGTFAARSPDYFQQFSCYVSRGANIEVLYLAEPISQTLIGSEDTLKMIYGELRGERDHAVEELLFVRRSGGSRFEFQSMQPFSLENFEMYNQ